MYFSGAKFEEYLSNIFWDILDSVLYCFSGITYDVVTFLICIAQRPRHTMRQIAATSRLVCTVAATSRLRLVCRCDMSHKFKPVWICATDRSDNDFHMSHEAICCSNLSRRRVAAICRIVCLGLKMKEDISKRKTPFLILKSLSDKQQLFFYSIGT